MSSGPDAAVRDALAACVEGRELEPGAMRAAMAAILAGDADLAQIAGLAVALRMRGETAQQIEEAARALRDAAQGLDAQGPLLDTCGTGGDGAGTFNISTTSAVVLAACGVRVAKHGNRAVSSRAGSADVLEALGIRLELSDEEHLGCLDAVGITFLFAPAHHGAMRHAAQARRSLGLRTFFNLLGPLANPAKATHQLLGVYDAALVVPMASALRGLGVSGAWVVHGHGGLDEVASDGPSSVAILRDGEIEERTVEPSDFGLERASADTLLGGDAQTNAEIARRIWSGQERGGPRTAVLLNAAAGLCAVGAETSLIQATERAAQAIDDGAATSLYETWRQRVSGP